MCTQTDGHLSLSPRETFWGVRLREKNPIRSRICGFSKGKKETFVLISQFSWWFFPKTKRRLFCINSLFLLIMILLATWSNGEIIGIFSIGIDLFGEDVWGICIGPWVSLVRTVKVTKWQNKRSSDVVAVPSGLAAAIFKGISSQC